MQLMCCVRRSLSVQLKSNLKTRQFCLKTCKKQLEVGVLCDIDGVLVRGRTLITGARESVRLLYDHDIPVVFLTNQVLQLEKDKAEDLSRMLDLKVHPDQVVMSHSPLRLYKDLFEKFVLVLGQLDVQAVASSGFKNICDIEDVRRAYPLLDMIDKEKRYENLDKYGRTHDFPKIEGIVLLGEPIKWECILQLCMDLLVSDGNPSRRLPIGKVEHMPVVACNPDLTWMAEAPLPRFGHGAFLLCLESLFKKITGNELKYTTITGKPFLTTFKYAERLIRDILAKANGSEMSKSLKRIYVIGDNPDSDIYGSNLFKQHLTEKNGDICNSSTEDVISILVETGVYCGENFTYPANNLNHQHKDILFESKMIVPNHIVPSIVEATKLILERESTF